MYGKMHVSIMQIASSPRRMDTFARQLNVLSTVKDTSTGQGGAKIESGSSASEQIIYTAAGALLATTLLPALSAAVWKHIRI